MARLMREISSQNGSFGLAGGETYWLFWVALFTLCIISTLIFSCSDGMSKDRNSTVDVELYGGGCAAGCGAGCGA
uniref:Transmembrane protein n=1 Tax=Cucumis sativus TaxID=3659 RepID=A0A0A0LQU7_CUCSA